jgi:predicted phosphodiesterase
MKQKILFTSDLHLTDRYADEYRWKVFHKLRQVAREEGATVIAILGDITDAKGGHSSALVNRMCAEIDSLSQDFEVYILKGNHDYTEEHLPFFGFLDLLPNVRFLSSPELIDVGGTSVLAIPHAHSGPATRFGEAGTDQGSRNTLVGRVVTGMVREGGFDMIWIHNTVRGSVYSNGKVMENHGVDLTPPSRPSPRRHSGLYEGAAVPIIAGDVHVPQKVGPVTYLGAPHPVCFGDKWLPRFMVSCPENGLKSIPIDSIQKHSLTLVGPEACEDAFEDVGGGDQIKVIVRLARDEMGMWQSLRESLFKQAARSGGSIESMSMQCYEETFLPDQMRDAVSTEMSIRETYGEYCKENMVSTRLASVGARILKL